MNNALAIYEYQAAQIRAFIAHEMGADILDAARILPLVGWDVELAVAYMCEEIEQENAREGRTYKAQPWKVAR